jgi:hypothetical protein
VKSVTKMFTKNNQPVPTVNEWIYVQYFIPKDLKAIWNVFSGNTRARGNHFYVCSHFRIPERKIPSVIVQETPRHHGFNTSNEWDTRLVVDAGLLVHGAPEARAGYPYEGPPRTADSQVTYSNEYFPASRFQQPVADSMFNSTVYLAKFIYTCTCIFLYFFTTVQSLL